MKVNILIEKDECESLANINKYGTQVRYNWVFASLDYHPINSTSNDCKVLCVLNSKEFIKYLEAQIQFIKDKMWETDMVCDLELQMLNDFPEMIDKTKKMVDYHNEYTHKTILSEDEYISMQVSLAQGHNAGYGGLYPKVKELTDGKYLLIG